MGLSFCDVRYKIHENSEHQEGGIQDGRHTNPMGFSFETTYVP